MTEDERVAWSHPLNGHKSEQTQRGGEGWEAWHSAVHGVAEVGTVLSHWTTRADLQGHVSFCCTAK